MRHAKPIVWTIALGAVAWALAGRGLVNYDALYALVWGRDLAHGTLPDYDVSLAPTPHPLPTLVGALLAPLGADGAIDATIVLAFLALGALGWITYRLGAAWINPAAGILAAAIILTRRPVLDFGARAYVDLWYLVLVLAALLVETRRRGEILREPVLIGAAGGVALGLAFLRRRVALAAVSGVIALVAFAILATAGLPILGRYLLLPATLLAIFAGAGAFGWAQLPARHPWRRRWAWFGVLTLVLLVAFAPAQAGRLDNLRDALRIQDGIQDDLHALTPRFDCTPVAVPNHRPLPLLALWLDVPPTRVAVARERRLASGTYVVPASAAVARQYVLDARDRDRTIAPPPPGFAPVAANASWRAFARCG